MRIAYRVSREEKKPEVGVDLVSTHKIKRADSAKARSRNLFKIKCHCEERNKPAPHFHEGRPCESRGSNPNLVYRIS